MFMPLNDAEPNHFGNAPIMTLSIIMLNTLIFGFELWLLQKGLVYFRTLIVMFGSIPDWIMHQQYGGAITSITSAFLHGGWSHLIGNMIFLWVFGRRVEDACGAWRFLGYYLFCAVFSDIISILVDPGSPIPSIGASGAIFGLMGAYLLIYPGGRIRTLVWLIVPLFPRIRAIWIILVYLIIQIPPALNVLVYGSGYYQVGYWAHLGGFFAAVFFPFFMRPEAFERYVNDVPV